MPTTRDSRALYRNRSCFRAAGVDPDSPPRTLEEAKTLAVRLTRRNGDGSLAQIGMFLPDDPSILFALFGGDIWNAANGRITADRPENVAALRWLVQLADAEGGFRAISAFTSGFGSDNTRQNPLATGKIAMRIDGEWQAMHLDTTDYALSELPYPAARPDLKNTAWEDGDFMAIPAGSRHPELAWKFMRWLEEPAQQNEYAAAMHNLPTLLALRNSPTITRGTRSKEAVGYVLAHIASNARNARFLPTLPITRFYLDVLRNAFDRALYHEVTPERALAEAQARVEREQRRYP
jgi:multiple sugar transport system substrate-binding protein